MTPVRRLAVAVTLILLPALFLLAELTLRAHALPYWLGFNLDPSYLYLMDGLQLLEGVTPGSIAHPGTPVQGIVALVAWVSGLGSPAGIPDAAFAGAETLLARASTVMLSLDAAALLLLGWTAWRRCGGIVPALLAQTAPFLTMLALKHGIEVEPEPMLLFSTALLGAAMIEHAFKPRLATLIAMGAVVGFGTACKITFAPLGLGPFLLLSGWRQRMALVAAAAVSLGIFVLPALGGADRALVWFRDLALGSGAYGQGPQIVVDPGRYPHAVVKLFFARPIFLVTFFASAGILLYRLRRRRSLQGPRRALFAMLMAQLVQILFVAKHPSAHYILPALELGGPSLALLWFVARGFATGDTARRRIELGFAAFLALLVVTQGIDFRRQDRELARDRAGALAIDSERDFPGCAHVFHDMASSLFQAWIYNFNFGPHPFGPAFARILPADDYSFLTWVDGLQGRSGPVDPASVAAQYPCIVLRGPNLGLLHAQGSLFGAVFKDAEICRAGLEYLLVAHAHCPGA